MADTDTENLATDSAHMISDTIKNQVDNKQSNYDDFKTFFLEFGSDSVFQKSRVRFPFTETAYDIEDNETISILNEDDWTYINLQYDSSFYYRQIDAYEQIFEINSDKAKVGYRGIDNGIYFDYIFENQDSIWVLTRFIDYSN